MIVFCYNIKDHESFVYDYPELVFNVVKSYEKLKGSIDDIL